MKKRTKIGIYGGVAYILLTLPSYGVYFVPQEFAPLFSCWSCLLILILFPTVGAFAASSTSPPRDGKQGSKDGAIAGFITGSIFGTMALINSIIVSSLGIPQRYIQQLPPESQEILTQSGIDALYSVGGQIAIMLCAIPVTIGLGVMLSTLGGLIYSSLRKD